MIILRQLNFSLITKMIGKVADKLEKDGLEDFEVSDKLSKDTINIVPDLQSIKIYIPEDLEYSQYEIDDYIRVIAKFIRVHTSFDRGYYIMTLSGPIQQPQLYKLIKFIMKENGFCTILENGI